MTKEDAQLSFAISKEVFELRKALQFTKRSLDERIESVVVAGYLQNALLASMNRIEEAMHPTKFGADVDMADEEISINFRETQEFEEDDGEDNSH